MPNTWKIDKLKSFAAGKSVRLIQSDNDLYHFFRYSDLENANEPLQDTPVSGDYLMKDVKSLHLNNIFTDSFKTTLKDSMNAPESAYYDLEHIEFDNAKKLLKSKSKAYLLDFNSYEEKEDHHYKISTSKESFNEATSSFIKYNDMMSSYIASTYSDGYFEKSQCADNKSMPIYDIDNDALSKLESVRMFGPAQILSLLKKYPFIQSISGSVLFNSSELSNDEYSYDSIMIDPILTAIAVSGIQDVDELFSDILSNVPMNSFYRFLNPIGVVDVCENLKDSKNANDANEYIYSLNLNDTMNLKFNYFSTKTLKNPELYHDYSIFPVENKKSVMTYHFSLINNIIAKIISDFNTNVIEKIKSFIYSYEFKSIYNAFAAGRFKIFGSHWIDIGDSIIDELTTTALQMYPKFDAEYCNKFFSDVIAGRTPENLMYRNVVKRYFETLFGVDINEDGFLIYEDDYCKFVSGTVDAFNESMTALSSTYSSDSFKDARDVAVKFIGIAASAQKDASKFTKDDTIMKQSEMFSMLAEMSDARKAAYEEFRDAGIVKPGIYLYNISGLMEKVAKIDMYEHNSAPSAYQDYPMLYSEKIADYLLPYKEMFKHENEMEMSGFLYGKREYEDALKDSFENPVLTYRYETRLDENFIRDNIGDVVRLTSLDEYKAISPYAKVRLNSIVSRNSRLTIVSDDVALGGSGVFFDFSSFEDDANMLNALLNVEIGHSASAGSVWPYKDEQIEFNVISSLFDTFESETVTALRISNHETVFLRDGALKKYFDMLKSMKDVDFVEHITGQTYYKEQVRKKSNVFSLNVKNSGLDYSLYSFNEMLFMFENQYHATYDSESRRFKDENGDDVISFFSALLENHYCKIKEAPETTKDELLVKVDDDFESFKYFKYADDLAKTRTVIKLKIQLRKTFEEAVRNSIHRYMPVNTTLWKIKYSGDN